MLIKKIRIFAGFDGFLNSYILFYCHLIVGFVTFISLRIHFCSCFFFWEKINRLIFHTFFFKKMIQLSSKFYSISAMSIFSESPWACFFVYDKLYYAVSLKGLKAFWVLFRQKMIQFSSAFFSQFVSHIVCLFRLSLGKSPNAFLFIKVKNI